MPKKVKRFVDYAVAQFASDPSIKELYQKWCEVNRQKLSMYHDSLQEDDVPLEDNSAFRSLKNAVIQAALEMDFTQLPTENYSNIGGLLSQLAKQIAQSCVKKLDALNRKTVRREKKEQQKINEKKLAHGLKPGGASEKEEEEPTENFSLEPLLDTVDIILLNKKPTKLRRVHVPSEEKIQEDYEAYLREKYGDDYDEELDGEEGQGWAQSM